MINREIKDILCAVRDNAAQKGIVASLIVHYEKSHLMRIGNNSVSLNTSEELTRLSISVLNGKKEGSHSQTGNIPSIEYVEKALAIAVEKSKIGKDKDYQPIADLVEENQNENSQFDEALANLDPAFKAKGYEEIFNTIGNKYNFSGSWSSGASEIFFVTTSNKNEASHKISDQLFNIVLKHPVKNWELSISQTGWQKTAFSAEKVIADLKEMVEVYENNDGFKVKPGDYTVILGAQAIAEVMQMAVYTGFSGMSFEEKQGWTAKNKFGDIVLGTNINIVDDPKNDYTFKFGFDMTGKTRKEFSLVENGAFKNLMYGNFPAAKYNKKPTGHDLQNTSIVFKTGNGDENVLEAVKDFGKVLYIPALHYINLPDSNKGIFTGSSRFNALLIEDGKIKSPIFSSRITDTFQNVFGNVKVISSKEESINLSNTYGERSPVSTSVPSYIIAENVKITDCAESF